MIKVFVPKELNEDINFQCNGDKIIHPFRAVILKEDNGDYELELETRIADKDFIVNDNIVVVKTPWGNQGFRVYNPQKKGSKITCTCKHLFYDTAKYLIKDTFIVEKNCNLALDQVNSNTDAQSPFITLSDNMAINSFRCVRKSLEEAINTILERWGGHLVRDNYKIEIRNEVGKDNGVTLRYGKNIQDITCKEDWSKVVTKLMPVGKDGLLLDEEYLTTNDIDLNSPNYGITYTTPYTKVVSFSQDIEQEEKNEEEYKKVLLEDLRKQALDYLTENCVPKISYSIKANVEKVTDIGDTIEVYDERLNIKLVTNIVSVKWDCIQERYTEINFGNFQNKLKNLVTNITNSTKNEVKDAITNTVVPEIDGKLQTAYEKIWNALGESYCIYDGDQILIVDKLPKEEAKNCIRFNSQGIGFSKNGINGKFTSAWTIDGTLNMQEINVINLVADMIKGGTLKLGSATQGQGRIEIYDNASTLIGEFNENGITMYSKDGGYIKINNEVGFAGYDKNNNKIYWVDKDIFCTKKFVANEEITIGGKLRMLPITTAENNGIGFVAIYNVT